MISLLQLISTILLFIWQTFALNARQNLVVTELVPGKTLGQVWPLPQYIIQQKTYLTLNSATFQFIYEGASCPIVDNAINRYKNVIFNPPRFAGCINQPLNPQDLQGQLDKITISLMGNCESWPYFKMDETYALKVNLFDANGTAQLLSNSSWGIIRGLESFSQIIYHDDKHNFYVNSSVIVDYPRFPFRGFMLDTSRHFVPLPTIKQHLDAMAYNKFNIFHWHVTDDQSFPYQSQIFPSLSDKGAFNPKTHIYTLDDVTSVINYAAALGIRVIPEFDTPGHTESWGPGQPGLLTPCYAGTLPDGTYGPINPILNSTYTFLNDFFAEIGKLFPDAYIHLGGDEVDFTCWASNPDVRAFMMKMGFGNNYALLESYFINKLLQIMGSIPTPKDYIVWQEVFDNGCQINKNTLVNVWKDDYVSELANVTAQGFRTILSSCWYLSDIHYGNDWVNYYQCEPLAFTGNTTQKDLVLGGSGCMWGEYVDATNLMARTWPRAAAVAERLWSSKSATDSTAAKPRLEEHRCRLLERGIDAQPPSGPNFCPADYLVF